MACNSCAKQNCYTNPCNSCGSCGGAKDCNCAEFGLDFVPHTNCAISIKHGECSDTLDLCPAIKKCQSVTHMDFNYQTGCIEYQNEKFVYTDGAEDDIERVCVSDFLPFINLNELNDVQYDDELPGNCYELIYKKDISCGDGCKAKTDHWENFNINTPGARVFSMDYLRGATEDGCPVYMDKPDNCSMLVFSPSCSAPTGEWQPYNIPNATKEITPDSEGYYKVLTKNSCGCIEESKMPVMPAGMTALNYQRDSVPDDPDFPWYYGCYNDKINLHLRENAPKYFGKYALKITINYGVQAIKSDVFTFNYNWRSLVVPVVEGEAIRTEIASSILQNWAMAGAISGGRDIPWGSSALRGSLTFVVPKGKEAYLHHEMRIRTTASFPDYYTGSWDGQRVPDTEATLNHVKHPATRLNALQVIIEPTQGSTDYDPAKDDYRGQLDAPVDSYPQAF